MDTRFLPALAALARGETQTLRQLVASEPELARARSSCSHPTLLQAVVLETLELPAPTQLDLAQTLIDAGAELDEPLVAAGSVGNRLLAEILLERGASIDGREDLFASWSALDECLYWGNDELASVLLERGASTGNLRRAAGLGRGDEVDELVASDGTVRSGAGPVNFPWGDKHPEHRSSEPQDILDNALVYAAMGGHLEVVRMLHQRGAVVTCCPLGFHYRGTALHWAAIRGRREPCELLLHLGADRSLPDQTIGKTAAEWAAHDGHNELAEWLAS